MSLFALVLDFSLSRCFREVFSGFRGQQRLYTGKCCTWFCQPGVHICFGLGIFVHPVTDCLTPGWPVWYTGESTATQLRPLFFRIQRRQKIKIENNNKKGHNISGTLFSRAKLFHTGVLSRMPSFVLLSLEGNSLHTIHNTVVLCPISSSNIELYTVSIAK